MSSLIYTIIETTINGGSASKAGIEFFKGMDGNSSKTADGICDSISLVASIFSDKNPIYSANGLKNSITQAKKN